MRQEEPLALPDVRHVPAAEPVPRPAAGDSGADGLRLERVLRRLDVADTAGGLGDRSDEPVTLVEAAQELALCASVPQEEEQCVPIAVDVDDVDLGAAVSRDAKLEDLTATIRRDVDLRTTVCSLRDTHPGADRSEPPLERICCHDLSLPAADIGVGRTRSAGRASPSIPRHSEDRRSRQATSPRRLLCLARPKPDDVVQATRLPFDPGSPTAGCAIRDGRRPTWRGFGARASRTLSKMRRRKPKLNTSVYFFLRAGGVFLPQAGPRFGLVLLKLGITSWSYRSATS